MHQPGPKGSCTCVIAHWLSAAIIHICQWLNRSRTQTINRIPQIKPNTYPGHTHTHADTLHTHTQTLYTHTHTNFDMDRWKHTRTRQQITG